MIHVEDRGEDERVRLVTIDRPERRNALNLETLEELLVAIEGAGVRAGSDGATRGAGPGRRRRPLLRRRRPQRGRGRRVRRPPQPPASPRCATCPCPPSPRSRAPRSAPAPSSPWPATCASPPPTPRFGIPAAKLGLMVDQWTVQPAGRPGRATARPGPCSSPPRRARGADATGFGFVQRVGGVADGLEWADRIAALAPLTIAGHKVGLNEAERLDGRSEAYSDAFARAWGSADLQEGLAAFGERRPARFAGQLTRRLRRAPDRAGGGLSGRRPAPIRPCARGRGRTGSSRSAGSTRSCPRAGAGSRSRAAEVSYGVPT